MNIGVLVSRKNLFSRQWEQFRGYIPKAINMQMIKLFFNWCKIMEKSLKEIDPFI